MTRLPKLGAGLLLALQVGCSGGPAFAPVSGVVSIDGKPYPKAVVSYQPLATEANPAPGRGSSAYTDSDGRYALKGLDGEDGALVGRHRVRLMTRGNDVTGQLPEGESSADGAPKSREVDPIPPEWNATSAVEFDVPAGGSAEANFDIPSRKRKK